MGEIDFFHDWILISGVASRIKYFFSPKSMMASEEIRREDLSLAERFLRQAKSKTLSCLLIIKDS
jgi:hypothetical protein